MWKIPPPPHQGKWFLLMRHCWKGIYIIPCPCLPSEYPAAGILAYSFSFSRIWYSVVGKSQDRSRIFWKRLENLGMAASVCVVNVSDDVKNPCRLCFTVLNGHNLPASLTGKKIDSIAVLMRYNWWIFQQLEVLPNTTLLRLIVLMYACYATTEICAPSFIGVEGKCKAFHHTGFLFITGRQHGIGKNSQYHSIPAGRQRKIFKGHSQFGRGCHRSFLFGFST